MGVRLGEREQHRTLRACATGGGTGLSIPSPLLSGRREALFVGTTMPGHGDSSIGVDACQTGDLGTVAHWPRVRAVLRDPNTGCSFFGDDGCDPFEDEDSLKPGYAPAYVYLFEWGRLRPEPDEEIELLEKPYLNLPSPSSGGTKTLDSIFLYRATLPIASGAGTLADCGDWPTARGDVLLTRLRPDTFTRPGYTPPDGSQTTSPPLNFWASDIHPWDDNIMGDSMPIFSEPLDLTYDVPLGDNVENDSANQFIARLLMNPLNEPRRAPYTIIGQAFDVPLVVGTLHTVHADLCLVDGDTCQARPEGTSIPVYSVPVPDQPGDEVWVDLSTTWWEPLTVEETGAQSGDATGKDIPHPKGLLSSMKDSESLAQLKQRLRWNLVAAPVLTPDILDTQEPAVENDPFQHVVPQARLNVTEPGVYEVEFAIEGDEGEPLVVDKVRFISLDIDAHWPGTITEPGSPVSDAEENDPLNLFMAVNDDDDNFDHIVDNEMDDATGSPTVDADDDDLITVIVRKFTPPISGEGTVSLILSDGLRLFTADGTQEIPVPLTVDFATPVGPLADVVTDHVTFLVEADQVSDDAVIDLVYSQAGQELTRDSVHIAVLNPDITGSFTRGSVQYATATELAGKWAVGGALTVQRPLSVLVPVPQGRTFQALQYDRDDSQSVILTPIDEGYFDLLEVSYNAIIGTINLFLQLLGQPLLEPYSSDALQEELSAQMGISVDELRGGNYFVMNQVSAGLYAITFCHNRLTCDEKTLPEEQLAVLKVDATITHGGDTGTGVADDREEYPGAITAPGPENRMALRIRKPEPADLVDQLQPVLAGESLTVHVGSETVRLWEALEDSQDPHEVAVIEGHTTFPVTEMAYEAPIWKTLWIEATQPSASARDVAVDLEFLGGKDVVTATVVQADLDIDSDNDNGFGEPEQNEEEDQIEYSEFDTAKPGKIITDSDVQQAGEISDLTPLVLKISEGFSEAIVKFTYSAADPNSAADTGHLRIWTEDGRFVQPATEYPIANLGSELDITLFVEGVQETSLNEERKIHVGVDPNGGGEDPGFIAEDLVMVTVVRVDVDIIDPESGQTLDEEFEDDPGKVVAVNFDDDDCDGKGYTHGESDVTSDKDDLNGIVKSAESASECMLDNLDGDDDLIPLTIRQLDKFAGYADLTADFVLDFDNQHIALWQHQEKCAPEDIAYEACSNDKVISWRENPAQATRFPVSKETTLWVEGTSPHGNTDGTRITVTLFVNDEAIGEDSVKIIVADPIFVLEGTGSFGLQSPLSIRLQDKIIEEHPPLYIVKGGNGVYYSLAFYETQDMFKRALATEGSVVMYNGHANYGIGPAFSWNLESLSAFMNIGRPDPEPTNPDKGSFTGIDWNYLRTPTLTEPRHPTLEISDEEIPLSPVNYPHPFLPNRLRFENNNEIGAEEHFSLQGEGYSRHHYTTESADEPRLIVKTGHDDVPSLRYRALLMRNCNSGDYYLETFQQGVFFYLIYPDYILSEAPLAFIEGVVEGDSWEQIKNALNATVEQNTYDYHIWEK